MAKVYFEQPAIILTNTVTQIDNIYLQMYSYIYFWKTTTDCIDYMCNRDKSIALV